jgi:hypothetical protein
MNGDNELIETAKKVLEQNDNGSYTIPSHRLYPHQWLWDSCFIAIGLSNYDIERAQLEILSLLRGQWSNGMMPNIIFSPGEESRRVYADSELWRSWISPFSPDDITTSGITQPPMLAEAIVQIGKKLSLPERRSWYKSVYPALLSYHNWIYEERDPHEEGLALLIHPWEVGMDNTPPWMSELNSHVMPSWIRIMEKTHLSSLLTLFRRDVRLTHSHERLTNAEILSLYSIMRRIRRKNYDINRILPHSLFAIEDLFFNCILIRANKHLREIAKTLKEPVPEELKDSMKKTESALEELWDTYTNQYYSRNFITHDLIKESSIATLMPLYAGVIEKERADKLIKLLESRHIFGPEYPVPSTPLNSTWFKESGYWQGPTWINTNWLVIEGLKSCGYETHAEALKEATLELIEKSGMNEYFSPITGEPAGSDDFSWTAALAIDLSEN